MLNRGSTVAAIYSLAGCFIYFNLSNFKAAEESQESEPDTESVQTSSTPTPSETTESQSASPPERESGISMASSAPDSLDTGSLGGTHESKNENGDGTRMEGESNRTDNDVDEGVDLQGKQLCFPRKQGKTTFVYKNVFMTANKRY